MLLQPQSFALLFTVVLLTITAYFLLGSLPLLVLKHDNPMDARFVRSFYLTYFRVAFVAALATCISYAWAGRYALAFGAAMIGLLTVLMRQRLLSKMAELSELIQANELVAIPAFMTMHKSAIMVNATQFVAILLSLGAL